jgi:hypothetical protein
MGDTSRLPSIDDFANAEHCVLEDVPFSHTPKTTLAGERQARNVRHDVTVSDALRGRKTRVVIYAEGLADVEVHRRGREPRHSRFDLRFLDSVPKTVRHQASGLFRASGFLAGLSGFLVIAGSFGWVPGVLFTIGLAGFGVTAATMFTGVVRSYEDIGFRTLHGHAEVLRLRAGLGTIGQFHVLIPKLADAIAEAAESIHEETAVYLRAEMREHYRLRGEGVLTDEECASSTGKILNEFDDKA